MADIFLKVVNMSISACWIVLAIVLLRIILKKAPKWINCLLWGIAGLRLVMPFSLESIFSLIPSAEFIPQELVHSHSSVDVKGTEILNYVGNNPVSVELGISDGSLVFNEITAPDCPSINPLLISTYIASIVWIVGIIALLVYTLVSFLRLKQKIGTAVLLRDNIYQCEAVVSPFVLGIIRPKIYLPFNMGEQEMEHVIAHEQAHLRRKDHLWKPLGFLILTLHWFNPLVWLGYILLCRDIELACDEKVVKELNNEQRADYSQALLSCSVNRRMVAACPVAFGEVGVKNRVKSVLNYKKPAFWVIAVAIVLCIVLAFGFLTNPKNTSVFNSKYETGKCLYSDVVSAEKETKTNNVVYSITAYGVVFRTFEDGTTEELGELTETDFTADALKETLNKQGEKIDLGKTKNAYEILNEDGKYVVFQKSNGTVYLVSFFSDGNIMNVFKLKRTGDYEEVIPHIENEYTTIISYATFDVDGDGKDENCALTYGPTSGLFTIVFTAIEVGEEEPEYINTFNLKYSGGRPEFYKSQNGEIKLKCYDDIWENGSHDRTEEIFLDIEIENGNIVLKDGDENIAYWGEQGMDPIEFLKKINAIENAVGEAILKENDGKYFINERNKRENPSAKAFETHEIVHYMKNEEKQILTVYAIALYEEFNLENGKVVSVGSGSTPVEIVFNTKDDSEYTLKKYRSLPKEENIEDYISQDRYYDDEETMENLRQKIRVEAYNHYGIEIETP